MKIYRFVILLIACLLCLPSVGKKKGKELYSQTRVYVIGFSASFIDSVAYVTGIQTVDSVTIENKTGFMVDRTQYSEQLQSYLEGKRELAHPVTSVFFSTKKRKMDKMMGRLMSRYTNQDGLKLTALDTSEFHFHAVAFTAPSEEEIAAHEAEKKAAKKAAKKKKGGKGSMPPPPGGHKGEGGAHGKPTGGLDF